MQTFSDLESVAASLRPRSERVGILRFGAILGAIASILLAVGIVLVTAARDAWTIAAGADALLFAVAIAGVLVWCNDVEVA